ncbi:hypothetical protein BC628DRAFT_1338432 [Trametes gibbosa]|nr:hypothetical protein BC628DRAFT_1338432 [Trametes gibbosa]
MELPDDIAYGHQTSQRVRRHRKRTLFEARRSTVVNSGLAQHTALFDKLSPQNMTRDDSDDARSIPLTGHRITESHWQSDVFKAFMRELDCMYREDRAGGDRPRAKNPSRTEISVGRGHKKIGYAPRRLWRNCYNAEWVRGLTSHEKRKLHIVDADYDFNLGASNDDTGHTNVTGNAESSEASEQANESADEVEEEL